MKDKFLMHSPSSYQKFMFNHKVTLKLDLNFQIIFDKFSSPFLNVYTDTRYKILSILKKVLQTFAKCWRKVVFPQPMFPSTRTVKGLVLATAICKICTLDFLFGCFRLNFPKYLHLLLWSMPFGKFCKNFHIVCQDIKGIFPHICQ